MPAVELGRLQHQIDHVIEVFSDTRLLRSRVLDLLEFYAVRLRPGPSARRTGSVRSLGVTTAVMRTIEHRLAAQADADPYAGAMAAEALWATPVMEARWLAVSLLERQPVATLPDWVSAWSRAAEDPQLLERLAAGPMRRIWRADPELFWRTAAIDLRLDSAEMTVTFLTLEKIVPELDPDELPRVFALLEESPVPRAGEAWRAYVAVVRVAAVRSPPETARFLVDEIEHARPGATRLARQMLTDFPPRQREVVRQALRLTETINPPPAR